MNHWFRSERRAVLVSALAIAASLAPFQASAQQRVAEPAKQGESWFGIDKIKHFFLAAFVESVAFSAMEAAGASRRPSLTAAIAITAAVSVGREIHGIRSGTGFSKRDLVWDAAGAAAATALLARTEPPRP